MDQGVGREVKRLREERGWSQAKLAVEADMSVSGVSMIENGQRNLTTTTLAKLAGAFGLEIADLFLKAEAPLPFEDAARRLDAVPDALSKYMKGRAEYYGRELTDPDSAWFANATIASLWMEQVSHEAGMWRAWVEENASVLQPPTDGLSDMRGWRNALKLVGHAALTFQAINRRAKRRIEAMTEGPDDLARKRLEKAEADIQENVQRMYELQEAASG